MVSKSKLSEFWVKLILKLSDKLLSNEYEPFIFISLIFLFKFIVIKLSLKNILSLYSGKNFFIFLSLCEISNLLIFKSEFNLYFST